MALFRTVAPEGEPLSVGECKAYLRIDHGDDDALLGGLVRAAREEVERHTGTALLAQDWRMTLDCWPRLGRVTIPLHPVREILSVTVHGEDGEASLLDPAGYQLDPRARPARLDFADRPAPAMVMNGIEIDLRAGFGEAGADVPDLLKRAMILLVAHWYEFRAAHGAADQPVSMPEGFSRLVAGYRSRRLT